MKNDWPFQMACICMYVYIHVTLLYMLYGLTAGSIQRHAGRVPWSGEVYQGGEWHQEAIDTTGDGLQQTALQPAGPMLHAAGTGAAGPPLQWGTLHQPLFRSLHPH